MNFPSRDCPHCGALMLYGVQFPFTSVFLYCEACGVQFVGQVMITTSAIAGTTRLGPPPEPETPDADRLLRAVLGEE